MPCLTKKEFNNFIAHGQNSEYEEYIEYTTNYLSEQRNRNEKERRHFNNFCQLNFEVNGNLGVIRKNPLADMDFSFEWKMNDGTVKPIENLIKRFQKIGYKSEWTINNATVKTIYIPNHYQNFRLRNEVCEYVTNEVIGCVFGIDRETRQALVLTVPNFKFKTMNDFEQIVNDLSKECTVYMGEKGTKRKITEKHMKHKKEENKTKQLKHMRHMKEEYQVIKRFGSKFMKEINTLAAVPVSYLSEIVEQSNNLSNEEFMKMSDKFFHIIDDGERPVIKLKNKTKCRREYLECYFGMLNNLTFKNGKCMFEDMNGELREVVVFNRKLEQIWTCKYLNIDPDGEDEYVDPSLVKHKVINSDKTEEYYYCIRHFESIYA